MAWTTPKTWTAGNTLTAAELNEQVRDNLDFLYNKPGADYVMDEAVNYTTTSTTFVDVDASNLALTITTGGGDVLVWLSNAYMTCTIRDGVHFDIDVDGSRAGGDDGIAKAEFITNASGSAGATNYASLSMTYLVTGLAAGSHTFKLQWRKSYTGVSFPVTWYVGAGTTYSDLHPQFGVREL